MGRYYTYPPEIDRRARVGVLRDQGHDRESIEGALRQAATGFLNSAAIVETADGPKRRIEIGSAITCCWRQSKNNSFAASWSSVTCTALGPSPARPWAAGH